MSISEHASCGSGHLLFEMQQLHHELVRECPRRPLAHSLAQRLRPPQLRHEYRERQWLHHHGGGNEIVPCSA